MNMMEYNEMEDEECWARACGTWPRKEPPSHSGGTWCFLALTIVDSDPSKIGDRYLSLYDATLTKTKPTNNKEFSCNTNYVVVVLPKCVNVDDETNNEIKTYSWNADFSGGGGVSRQLFSTNETTHTHFYYMKYVNYDFRLVLTKASALLHLNGYL